MVSLTMKLQHNIHTTTLLWPLYLCSTEHSCATDHHSVIALSTCIPFDGYGGVHIPLLVHLVVAWLSFVYTIDLLLLLLPFSDNFELALH